MRVRHDRRRDVRVLCTLVVVAVAGCAESRDMPEASAVPPPGAADALLVAAARVALPPPAEPAALPEPDSDGARLVAGYCTACHLLPTPSIHSATAWPRPC